MAHNNKSQLLSDTFCGAVPMLMASFFAIAFSGVIEVAIRVLLKFRRRRGLYFWSLLTTTGGITLCATGSVLDFAESSVSIWFIATISLIGWICMVSGQSIVLWSRLHLVLHDDAKIRAVLILIITNGVIFHTSVGVLYLGSQSPKPTLFLHVYNVFEKIQLTVFALQEILISGLYIHSAAQFVGVPDALGAAPQRKTMKELLFVNLILILLDILVVSLQYANLYDLQISFKVAAYSIKLRIEFDILNRLVRASRTHSGDLSGLSDNSGEQVLSRRRSF